MLIVYNDLHRFNKKKKKTKKTFCVFLNAMFLKEELQKSLKITQKHCVDVTVKYLHPSTEFRYESSWSL